MESKPGIRTSEFWLVILVNVLPELGAIDVGDARVKGLIHLVTIAGYAIARGLAKQGVPAGDMVVPGPVAPGDGVKHAGL